MEAHHRYGRTQNVTELCQLTDGMRVDTAFRRIVQECAQCGELLRKLTVTKLASGCVRCTFSIYRTAHAAFKIINKTENMIAKSNVAAKTASIVAGLGLVAMA